MSHLSFLILCICILPVPQPPPIPPCPLGLLVLIRLLSSLPIYWFFFERKQYFDLLLISLCFGVYLNYVFTFTISILLLSFYFVLFLLFWCGTLFSWHNLIYFILFFYASLYWYKYLRCWIFLGSQLSWYLPEILTCSIFYNFLLERFWFIFHLSPGNA